jgi:hypothetical protein
MITYEQKMLINSISADIGIDLFGFISYTLKGYARFENSTTWDIVKIIRVKW